MNYLQAHYCAAFAHSVPAYITYCYGIALNKQILYCRPKRTSDGAGRLTRCRLRFHFFPFSVRWSPLTLGFLPAILRRCKFYTLYRKTVNVLHQWFSRNIIFTATTLYLKHIRHYDFRSAALSECGFHDLHCSSFTASFVLVSVISVSIALNLWTFVHFSPFPTCIFTHFPV